MPAPLLYVIVRCSIDSSQVTHFICRPTAGAIPIFAMHFTFPFQKLFMEFYVVGFIGAPEEMHLNV